MEEISKNKQNKNAWVEVILNIAFAFLLVIGLAFILSVAEGIIKDKVSLGSSVWHEVFGIKTAYAAPLKGFEAMQVSATGQLTMKPGESKKVSFGFQNIGTAAWTNTGTNFVSVYTYEPKYRSSVFFDSFWVAKDQPVKLLESKVGIKEVGHITFTLKAPTTVGTYKETFALAAEDKAWIPGGQFTITITVANEVVSSSIVTPKPSEGGLSSSDTNGYAAVLLLKSIKKTIQVKGGEVITFTAGIKNSGTKTWTSRSIKLPDVSVASSVSYKDSSWVDSKTAITKTDGSVAPGAMDLITFNFKAPVKKGSYVVKFALAADEVSSVPGGEIEIPIEVTSNAANAITSEETNDVDQTENLIAEPVLRVGVLIVDEETDNEVIITCESDFVLKDGNGALLAEVEEGRKVEAFYKKGKYWFDRGNGLESTSFYIRFIPNEANAVCTVTNFDRRESRNAAHADNQFRNVLEIRYNEPNDRVWLINELPMEYYLRGLGETSNDSNLEFQKALLTAARTYALYHFERATKHASEFFHVDAYADQVYYGYGQEARTPRITQAVEETRGQTVTYDGKTAITPYFSRSDGRTRSWNEVWGGTVAWCLTVKTPHDAGKTLWGHGVGMSASEALAMGKAGSGWDEIIKYFYTGIEIEKKWK
ncbi:MAG: SpoIID/LytB domain-containing protein [Patescibacteria group bacterium]